jgi:hypothetical protein
LEEKKPEEMTCLREEQLDRGNSKDKGEMVGCDRVFQDNEEVVWQTLPKHLLWAQPSSSIHTEAGTCSGWIRMEFGDSGDAAGIGKDLCV